MVGRRDGDDLFLRRPWHGLGMPPVQGFQSLRAVGDGAMSFFRNLSPAWKSLVMVRGSHGEMGLVASGTLFNP